MIPRVLVRTGLVLAPLLICGATVAAASDDSRDLVRQGIEVFTEGYNAWDADKFAKAAEVFDKACASAPNSCEAHYWKAVAEFHRLLDLLAEKNDKEKQKEAAERTKSAIDTLIKALRINDKHAESHALLSTVYGLSIAAKPARALWLGPRVMDQKKQALKCDPDNARAYYLLGMSQFHSPELLGGKPEALVNLLKAEKLFEAETKKERGPLEPRWGYSSCLTFIGRTYESLGKNTEGVEYFRKALGANPGDRMAREGLERIGGK